MIQNSLSEFLEHAAATLTAEQYAALSHTVLAQAKWCYWVMTQDEKTALEIMTDSIQAYKGTIAGAKVSSQVYEGTIAGAKVSLQGCEGMIDVTKGLHLRKPRRGKTVFGPNYTKDGFFKHKEVMRMKILAAMTRPGMTRKEIGDAVGISPKHASKNLYKLLKEGLVEIADGHGYTTQRGENVFMATKWSRVEK
jgi:predicted transcriptional regulator